MQHELPEGSLLKEISAQFNQLTIPRELLSGESLPPAIWARVVVEEGTLKLLLAGAQEPQLVTAENPAVIPAETEFKVSAGNSAVRFYLQYYQGPRIDDGEELAALLAGRGTPRAGRAGG